MTKFLKEQVGVKSLVISVLRECLPKSNANLCPQKDKQVTSLWESEI